jgi:NAD(P)H-flavin reductase/NAD-dependent dihydropyrimidine dehydrogenase PreA subunit/ferredoxin
MTEITLTIDGTPVKAQQGDTVLQAAQKAGIEIPTLCAHPALEPYGACRLCIVEIQGMRGYPPSCTTPASEGMAVKTTSPEIVELRKEVLRLMLSGHTSPCLVCKHREPCEKYRPRSFKAGRATRCVFCNNRFTCELRILADQYKIDDLNLPILYKNLPVERNDPFMDRDYNLCVLCGRCARICEKIHGKGSIDFINRGKEARIGTAFHKPHTETDCRFCGACIDICPTGSLSDRFAKWYGAPDRTQDSTCLLCPHGCSIRVKLKDGKAISSGMTGFRTEDRICAVGRFALPQILDNPTRLTSHQIRVPDGLIKTSYEEALAEAARRLDPHKGETFALVAHAAATREEIYLLRKFTREVMKSSHFAVARGEGKDLALEPASVPEAIAEGSVKAVYALGDFVPPEARKKIETLVVEDLFPSDTARSADVVIAAAALVETEGTFLNAAGRNQTLTAAALPPAGLLPDWKILCDLAKKMGASGFDYASAAEIRNELEGKHLQEQPPVAPDPSPLDDVAAIPRTYRGHRLSDVVCALRGLLAEEAGRPEPAAEAVAEKPFRILEKVEIVPNTHMVTVHAPVIAEKCLPGQFVIAMVNETSERIPYTISDFDREKGTISMVVLEVGRSSREMADTRAGQHLAHLAGPLGLSVEVKNYGTVVCAGGCFGVGAILPIARAMKEAGNRVICIEEASSHYLLHWQDRLSRACDELVIVTKDGSVGIKGGVQEAIQMLADRGEKIDQSYIIGCTFMMMMVSEQNKTLGIPTQTAMNPVMLDGTGMCGACRVSVGGSTKFACVDGPFLDGLDINWIELIQRQAAFKKEEIEGLSQEPAVEHALGHAHACMRA